MAGLFLPQIITSTDGKEHNTDLISNELVKNRVIYLNGEITSESALSVITQIKYLASKSNDDIHLVINSKGGSVSDGFAILDMMDGVDCDIVTIATGIAASMGALLLSAGAKGKRYATKNAEIMIHQPLGGVQGQATDISLVADHIQKIKRKLSLFLAERCNKELSAISEDMERDYWMSSKKAKKYGIVDVVGYPDFT